MGFRSTCTIHLVPEVRTTRKLPQNCSVVGVCSKMSKSGLGRGLEEIYSSTEGPDLSSFVTEEEMPDSPRAAVLWMIFGSVCFGTMNALVKWTSEHADVWMIIMVRSAVIAFAVAAFAATRGISLRINDRKTMLLRCSL